MNIRALSNFSRLKSSKKLKIPNLILIIIPTIKIIHLHLITTMDITITILIRINTHMTIIIKTIAQSSIELYPYVTFYSK